MMSERGEALQGVILDTSWDQHSIARAICEHLGLTWEDVDLLKGLDTYAHPKALEVVFGEHVDKRMRNLRERLATLLEAAGVER